MKNLLFLFCFFLVGSMSLNAQKACAKKGASCCAKKAAMKADAAEGTDTKVASASMEAAIEAANALADSDENIEKRVNAETGDVTYFEKSTCEVSGKVKWAEVEYCEKSQKFTKVASASMEKEIEVETSEAKKANCKGDKAKKACCAGKKGAKSCTKKGDAEK